MRVRIARITAMAKLAVVWVACGAACLAFRARLMIIGQRTKALRASGTVINTDCSSQELALKEAASAEPVRLVSLLASNHKSNHRMKISKAVPTTPNQAPE